MTPDYDTTFEDLYKSLGIYDAPPDEKCFHCSVCWKNMESQKTGYGVYRPWIGSKYHESRLAIVGINMNNYGGYDAEFDLAEAAVKEILMGRRRIKFSNPDYGGTTFWHRAPSYAVALLENEGLMQTSYEDGFPVKENIANAFDYFAITNMIKCSPDGERSRPAANMWERCGGHILRKEIEILEPKKILILGHSNNFNAFNNTVLDKSATLLKDYGSLKKGIGEVNGKEILFFVITHPTAYGGSRKKLMTQFIELVNST